MLGRHLSACYIEPPLTTVSVIAKHVSMQNRLLATTVLGFALLFSQGGNFLVAALCPHVQSGMASCETPAADPASSHEAMGHAVMDHEPLPASEHNPNAIALSQSHGSCSHCAVHSQTTPRAASLRETDTAKRTFDLGIALQFSRVAPVSESAVAVLSSRAHGPPGEGPARYILINNFRI